MKKDYIYNRLYDIGNQLVSDNLSKRFQFYLGMANLKLKDIERYENDKSIKWIYENKINKRKNPYLFSKDSLQTIDEKLLKKLPYYNSFDSMFRFVLGTDSDIFRIGYTLLCDYFNLIKNDLYKNKWFILFNCLYSGNSFLLANNNFKISDRLRGSKYEYRWNAYIKSANSISNFDIFLNPQKKYTFDMNYKMLFSQWGLYFSNYVEMRFKEEFNNAMDLKHKKDDYETGVHNREFNIYKKIGKKIFDLIAASLFYFDQVTVKSSPGYEVWHLIYNLNLTLQNHPNDDLEISNQLKEIGHYIAIDSRKKRAPVINEAAITKILKYNIDFVSHCSKKEIDLLVKSIDFSEFYDPEKSNPHFKAYQQFRFFRGELSEKENKTIFSHYKKGELIELCNLYDIDVTNIKTKKELCQTLHNYFIYH